MDFGYGELAIPHFLRRSVYISKNKALYSVLTMSTGTPAQDQYNYVRTSKF